MEDEFCRTERADRGLRALGIVWRRAGSRVGGGGLGASIMAQFPLVDPGVGLLGTYGPGPGKGRWDAAGAKPCAGA